MFSAWNKFVLLSATPEQLDFVQLAKNLTFTGESALNVSAWRQIMSMKDGNSFAILTIAVWLYGAAHAAEYLVTTSVCCSEGGSPADSSAHVSLMWAARLLGRADRAEWHLHLFTPHVPYRAVWHLTAPLLTATVSLLSHRSAFTMHVEAGHSAVPEEGPKDLRCPLCLYHTKYKRNMIDHIVLHRGNGVRVPSVWSGDCWTGSCSAFIQYFRLVSFHFSSLSTQGQIRWRSHQPLVVFFCFVSIRCIWFVFCEIWSLLLLKQGVFGIAFKLVLKRGESHQTPV